MGSVGTAAWGHDKPPVAERWGVPSAGERGVRGLAFEEASGRRLSRGRSAEGRARSTSRSGRRPAEAGTGGATACRQAGWSTAGDVDDGPASTGAEGGEGQRSPTSSGGRGARSRSPSAGRAGEALRCAQCRRAFSCASHLRRHERDVHQKVRLHPCFMCEASFKRRQHLEGHLQAIHGCHEMEEYDVRAMARAAAKVSGARVRSRSVSAVERMGYYERPLPAVVGSAPPYATATPPRVFLSPPPPTAPATASQLLPPLSSWHPQRETSASSGWTQSDMLAPETTATTTTDVSPPRDTSATDFTSWQGGAEPYNDWREFCNVLLQEPGAAHPNHVSGVRRPEQATASDLPVTPTDMSDAQAQRWPSMDALYPAADAYRNWNDWRASPPPAGNTLPLFRDLLPAASEPTALAYVEDTHPAARTGYPWRN